MKAMGNELRDRGADLGGPGIPNRAELDLMSILGPAGLSPDEIAFLEVVAVLTPTTTQIVDAVLNRNDTLSILQSMQHRGVALVKLSAGTPTEIVIQNLLASALRDRLECDDPARAVELRRRAVDVLVATGRIEQAVRVAVARFEIYRPWQPARVSQVRAVISLPSGTKGADVCCVSSL